MLHSRERVRYWRELRGLSQDELGELCGMRQYKISRIETGKNPASVDDIEAIASALGITMAEFYGAAPVVESATSNENDESAA